MLEKNAGKVRLVFKNFPLRMHRYAMEAAMAAMAADRQGKFWQFHDRLFLDYNQLSDQKIKDIAESLGLNMAEFDKQMKSPEIRAKIEKDIQDGRQAAVTGTPTVFINGRRVRDWSPNALQTLINRELTKIHQ
ncbi:MAG: thioredoxin domain-containing protein [Desulfobacterales bacterium]|nr:thioredoxin domain-containing protein [Desulfobacterales bacterium]